VTGREIDWVSVALRVMAGMAIAIMILLLLLLVTSGLVGSPRT
jgi:hypothetical protein